MCSFVPRGWGLLRETDWSPESTLPFLWMLSTMWANLTVLPPHRCRFLRLLWALALLYFQRCLKLTWKTIAKPHRSWAELRPKTPSSEWNEMLPTVHPSLFPSSLSTVHSNNPFLVCVSLLGRVEGIMDTCVKSSMVTRDPLQSPKFRQGTLYWHGVVWTQVQCPHLSTMTTFPLIYTILSSWKIQNKTNHI